MFLSERMKTARKCAGITQGELAQRLGTSSSAISQWETGLRNPKYENVEHIAVALNVSKEYLLGICDSPKLEGIEIIRDTLAKYQRSGLTPEECMELAEAKRTCRLLIIPDPEEVARIAAQAVRNSTYGDAGHD